eukprot:540764_1
MTTFLLAYLSLTTTKTVLSLISTTTCADGSSNYNPCNSNNPLGCSCPSFTETEIEIILDGHNDRRDLAASGSETCYGSSCPASSDMNYVFWDPALSTIATYWAHRCIQQHHNTNNPGQQEQMYYDLCQNNNCKASDFTNNPYQIGENLQADADYSSGIDAVLGGINAWYNEAKNYHWNSQSAVIGVAGHWTQGVWAKTRYIGCGYAVCSTGSPWGNEHPNWFNFVCKYLPGGNYGSSQPYTPTPTPTKCTECEDDRSGCVSSPISNSDALCGGSMCSSCVVDFFREKCTYSGDNCPDIIICNDGVSGPALQPTSRKMNGCNGVSAVPTVSPLPVTTYIVSNEVCNSVDNVMLKRLNTSFGYVLSGEYVYKGVYNGQAYYQKENNIGIYLWANVGPDWYYIGPDYTDNNLMAYCDIDTTTNSLKDCDIGHWHIDDNGWIIDSDATIKECNIGEISTTHIGSTDTTIDTTATAMDTTIDRPVCDSVNSVILSGLNSVLSVELNGEYIYQGQHLELPYYRYLKNANILLYVFERYNFYILGYNLNSSGLFAYCDSLIINDCTYGNWFYYNDGIDDFQINNGATIKKCDSDVIPSSTAIIDTTNKINTTSTFTPTITPTTEPIEGNNVLSHQKINYGFLRVLLCVLLGLLNANI